MLKCSSTVFHPPLIPFTFFRLLLFVFWFFRKIFSFRFVSFPFHSLPAPFFFFSFFSNNFLSESDGLLYRVCVCVIHAIWNHPCCNTSNAFPKAYYLMKLKCFASQPHNSSSSSSSHKIYSLSFVCSFVRSSVLLSVSFKKFNCFRFCSAKRASLRLEINK